MFGVLDALLFFVFLISLLAFVATVVMFFKSKADWVKYREAGNERLVRGVVLGYESKRSLTPGEEQDPIPAGDLFSYGELVKAMNLKEDFQTTPMFYPWFAVTEDEELAYYRHDQPWMGKECAREGTGRDIIVVDGLNSSRPAESPLPVLLANHNQARFYLVFAAPAFLLGLGLLLWLG